MGGILGASILGGSSLLGGLLSNSQSASSAQDVMENNDEEAATAYQRQVTDMKAAGLNPMFATNSGGNPIGTGSTFTSQNVAAPAAAAFTNAMATQNAEDQTVNQTAQTKSNIAKNVQDIRESQADIQQTNAQTALTKAQFSNTQADTYNKMTGGKAGSDLQQTIDGTLNSVLNSMKSSAEKWGTAPINNERANRYFQKNPTFNP